MNERTNCPDTSSLSVLPCSAENGEKEEVPEAPPEPPQKTAPPPPPPKKEEAGGAGLEFWGELEVQRVKFLVRTQQGHTETVFTPPLLPILFLSSPVPGRGESRDCPQTEPGPRHRAAFSSSPHMASQPLLANDPYLNLHTFAHLGPPAQASHPRPLSRAKSH